MSGTRESIIAAGAPYPPMYQGLGGRPEVIPDIPITAVFLVLYLIFGVIHIKILKNNKGRGHKFIFNGAILAWACHPTNIGLGIAAQTFVYVGTIILLMINWFFVQRIVRAQHQRLGWSTAYRIFHRAALAVLLIALIMVILVNIWPSFTMNNKTLRILRDLQLTGQTYFTIFCAAPALLVLISLLIPRREVEKFGAGRLRVNITILLLAVAILSAGQIFRCVITWIPQTPMRDAEGRQVGTPWYLHKACFYVFNFLTEILVVIMFAVVRVDLRFHVPNKSRMSGDYSGRNSRVNLTSNVSLPSQVALSAMASKKSLACGSPVVPMTHRNDSSDTLHQYHTSVFEDSRTLADSLKWGSSTLEVDQKTGAWKVKRVSTGSTSSRGSISSSQSPSRSSMNDRSVKFADEPVPDMPDWPLPNSHPARSSLPNLAPPSRESTPKGPQRTFEIKDHNLNGVDMGDAITNTLASLEHNSERDRKSPAGPPQKNKLRKNKLPEAPPPDYNEVARITTGENAPLANEKKTAARHNPLAPRQCATFLPKSALNTTRGHSSTNSTASNTPTISEVPELPQTAAPSKTHPNRRSSSLELITLSQRPNSDPRKIIDMSLQGDRAGDVSRPDSAKVESRPESVRDDQHQELNYASVARAPSSAYSDDTTSSDAREAVVAEEEFRRFSYEASPVSPLAEGDIMSGRRFD
ncbi:hypothetical protein EK21DRAFT_58349 [Setomelanomma holmii]|uniref:Uncharacterized protein n=1 Tax=Setomelanomma holmii TaxID=210430 RepID=A0A9P4HGR5_9PLEO|nr:hypothetical protein EK21DRAFT_58349 [Setomelanomma holmii]